MKTLKFALIALLIAGTMVSMANAEGFKSKVQPIKVVNVTIERAAQIPGLLLAMYEQIKADELLNGNQYTFVAEVTYQGVKYRISGTLPQWINFFKMQGALPFDSKSPIVGI
jgi:hypothetical protein